MVGLVACYYAATPLSDFVQRHGVVTGNDLILLATTSHVQFALMHFQGCSVVILYFLTLQVFYTLLFFQMLFLLFCMPTNMRAQVCGICFREICKLKTQHLLKECIKIDPTCHLFDNCLPTRTFLLLFGSLVSFLHIACHGLCMAIPKDLYQSHTHPNKGNHRSPNMRA